MEATDKITVDQLTTGDTFFYNGKRYDVLENSKISSSFNEIITISESTQQNLKLKRNTHVRLNETVISVPVKPIIQENVDTVKRIRNERGTLISVNLYNPEELVERKLSKDEIKKRDKCADELLSNDRFVDKYGDDKDNMNNVAYGTCTNRVKGVKNKSGKKEVQKESYMTKSINRINTIRKAIRRLPNEEL
jgi:predicted HTH domain antitoxin